MYFNGFPRRVLVTRVSEITPDNNAIVSLRTRAEFHFKI